MAPSHNFKIVAALTTMLACDVGTHAVADPPATPMLAAAAAKPDAAERKAKRAAKQARAEKAAKPEKTAAQKKAGKHPKPNDRPTTQPSTPTATSPGVQATALPACPPDNALTYRSFGDGFLRTWCTGCHSSTLAASDRQDAPEDVNFDRAALYKPHARDVYDRAVLEAHAAITDPNAASPMPPAGIVPEADRRRLAQWIACGSPGT